MPHPEGRRIYESGRPNWVWEQFQHTGRPASAARAPSVSYLIDNHLVMLRLGSKTSSFKGGILVFVDFHETGRSGSTAYWNCSEVPRAHAC
jgi:hypothetical protein